MNIDSSIALVESRWNSTELVGEAVATFSDVLAKRWESNDPMIYPTGFTPIDSHASWSVSLQMYLLAENTVGTGNCLQIVASLIEAYEKVKPNLSFGTLWVYDLLALRRFSVQSGYLDVVSSLIDNVILKVANTSVKRTGPSLRAFGAVTDEIVYVLLGETATPELVRIRNASGRTFFDANTYSCLKSRVGEGKSDLGDRLKRIRLLSRALFDNFKALYSIDQKLDMGTTKSKLGSYHKLFDRQFLLCAEAIENQVEATQVIDLIIQLYESFGSFNKPWVWEPGHGRIQAELEFSWRPSINAEYQKDFDFIRGFLRGLSANGEAFSDELVGGSI